MVSLMVFKGKEDRFRQAIFVAPSGVACLDEVDHLPMVIRSRSLELLAMWGSEALVFRIHHCRGYRRKLAEEVVATLPMTVVDSLGILT